MKNAIQSLPVCAGLKKNLTEHNTCPRESACSTNYDEQSKEWLQMLSWAKCGGSQEVTTWGFGLESNTQRKLGLPFWAGLLDPRLGWPLWPQACYPLILSVNRQSPFSLISHSSIRQDRIRQEPMSPFTRTFHDCTSSHFKHKLFCSKFKTFLRVLCLLSTWFLTPHSSLHSGGLTSLSREHTFCVSTYVTSLVWVTFSSIVSISTQPVMPSSGPTARLKSPEFPSPRCSQLSDHKPSGAPRSVLNYKLSPTAVGSAGMRNFDSLTTPEAVTRDPRTSFSSDGIKQVFHQELSFSGIQNFNSRNYSTAWAISLITVDVSDFYQPILQRLREHKHVQVCE